ncbi:nicotinate-nucleotide--dimethylbenzimidazole phosphoribosyltransferase [Vibrio furnissii]|uniref:nicotinate-nucleotide--dimethylbenzimidazole phosphoribosyltransferase n=1 Tax=Vibrio furnissii TaxID=29494 RepID=UPI0001B9354D|nr:nicotinate-nucleotide--dimethylbenzimidazole phosphoribosyltransferase [Vibrio furnissii]EEX41862.1 nicotinate-nucleotide--dimethylbenzimidazole phosphoribosyltransferase [Vibrio furnissii CIP 102972]WJG22848.1 nicotinate-nucleotide--dimethylbenzimidazole phosphoribosyltransferase [Vibrio furnissii]SUP45262.1 nicotinate-nucleotide--dimethylbenzimidazole phosphoribosyltransferase [Vibrio furnissii]
MLDRSFHDAITQRIDQKTKPLGALGQLEQVAYQLALIQSQGQSSAVTHIAIEQPTVLVFAGDHGIADEGVSIAPSAVTQQMVLNFLAGGAAINCFCRANQVAMKVVDTGILLPIDAQHPDFVVQRLGERTENFAHQAAMSAEQVTQGLALGQDLTERVIDGGSNLVMFGEMGIANTSSAAALLAALSGLSAEQCVGMGTGISEQQFEKKRQLVAQAVARCDGLDVEAILAEVGGFEIVQMVGAFLGASRRNTPVLVDGFIVTVAAYVATLLEPKARDVMIFAHRSHESGHRAVLDLLDAEPLLDLGLRLGEGTGAVLAVPLLRAAAEFYNTMASFAEAGVTV